MKKLAPVYSSSQSEMPIGVFDSGLGGLTVLRELRKALPNERFIYLGDTARTPYGSKGRETIYRYARECAHFLLSQQVKMLVVACNTVSAVALDQLALDISVPIVGTIEPAAQEVKNLSDARCVAVIGTQATIASASYEAALIRADVQAQILPKACPLFVPLVEQGMYEGEIVDKIIELYLADIRGRNADTIILGCTHYPMLVKALRRYLGNQVRIVECSQAVAARVAVMLTDYDIRRQSTELQGDVEQYFVTDDVARFNSLASLFLQGRTVQAVQLESIGSDCA